MQKKNSGHSLIVFYKITKKVLISELEKGLFIILEFFEYKMYISIFNRNIQKLKVHLC